MTLTSALMQGPFPLGSGYAPWTKVTWKVGEGRNVTCTEHALGLLVGSAQPKVCPIAGTTVRFSVPLAHEAGRRKSAVLLMLDRTDSAS
jgi:hypothetical protein